MGSGGQKMFLIMGGGGGGEGWEYLQTVIFIVLFVVMITHRLTRLQLVIPKVRYSKGSLFQRFEYPEGSLFQIFAIP